MVLFTLTLEPTYYDRGFFNVTVDYDPYVRQQEGPVHLIVGEDGEQTIEGHIDRRSNQNGTARIHGGNRLRDWFHAHFQPMDAVAVDLSSPGLIQLMRSR